MGQQELQHELKSSKILSFDEWYAIVEEEVNIELAESGADRELDFNSEREFEDRYEKYLDEHPYVPMKVCEFCKKEREFRFGVCEHCGKFPSCMPDPDPEPTDEAIDEYNKRVKTGAKDAQVQSLSEELRSEFFKQTSHKFDEGTASMFSYIKWLEEKIPHTTECIWKYDEDHDKWDTECGNAHCFIDGNITENNYTHCPYCGKYIKEGEE